jgi:hypothetical protein
MERLSCPRISGPVFLQESSKMTLAVGSHVVDDIAILVAARSKLSPLETPAMLHFKLISTFKCMATFLQDEKCAGHHRRRLLR